MSKKNSRVWYNEIKHQNPTYKMLLNTHEWNIRRYKILNRDNFKCQNCPCIHKKEMVVHHKTYISGLLPWESPDKDLITLCKKCHAFIHEKQPEIELSHKKYIELFAPNLLK